MTSATTPSDLSELVARSAIGGDFDEAVDQVTFEALLDDNKLLRAWRELRAGPPAFVELVTIREKVDIDAYLDEDSVPTPGTVFRITVSKAIVVSTLDLFFGSSLEKSHSNLSGLDHVRIADMMADASFTTFRSRFQRWTLDAPTSFAASEPLADPRRTTNDFTRLNIVPEDIRPWLLQSKPNLTSDCYVAWRKLAARRLLAATADQVSVSDTGGYIYHFSGPPSSRLEVADLDVQGMFERLNEGAVWTFSGGGRDTDTRHVLLAAEWARSNFGGNAGEGGLESAKSAYAAYVKAGSKETLKALADLRKSVVEDAQKATQRAQDMTASMWKDLAVASTPFVIKVLPDAGKTANEWFALFFAVGAIVFLAMSISLQIFTNERSIKVQREFRNLWKSRLNQVLTSQEVDDFSEKPVEDSLRDYRCVRNVIVAAYIGLILILGGFAFYERSTIEASRALNVPPLPTEHALVQLGD